MQLSAELQEAFTEQSLRVIFVETGENLQRKLSRGNYFLELTMEATVYFTPNLDKQIKQWTI